MSLYLQANKIKLPQEKNIIKHTSPRHMLNSELHSMHLVSKDCDLLLSQMFPAARTKEKKSKLCCMKKLKPENYCTAMVI